MTNKQSTECIDNINTSSTVMNLWDTSNSLEIVQLIIVNLCDKINYFTDWIFGCCGVIVTEYLQDKKWERITYLCTYTTTESSSPCKLWNCRHRTISTLDVNVDVLLNGVYGTATPCIMNERILRATIHRNFTSVCVCVRERERERERERVRGCRRVCK